MRKLFATAVIAASLMVMPSTAGADGVQHTIQPLDNDLSQCYAESIMITGALLLRDHTLTDGAGGTHTNSGYIWLQVTGVGTETGLEYRFVGDSFYAAVTRDELTVFTAGGVFKQIALDGKEDFTGRTIFHGTVDANGQLRTFFELGGQSCK